MANDGKITFSVWLDADEAEKELTSIKKKILDLEADLNSQQKVKSDMEERLRMIGAAADEAKAKLAEMQKSGAPSAAIKEQQSIVTGLDKDFNTAAAALEKQEAKIAETNAKLETQKTLFGQVQQQAIAAGESGVAAAEKSTDASDALSSRLEKLVSRIAGLAKRVLFFSLITRGLRLVREYFGDALKTSDEFTAAVGRLKGSLLTAFQPIYSAVLPAIITLINWLTYAITIISSFISALFGTTSEDSAAAAENLYNESKAIKSVGGAAAKAEKQLASFDEINQLSGSGGGGGGGAGSSSSPQFGTVELPPLLQAISDFMNEKAAPWFSDIATGFGNWFESIKEGAGILWEDLKTLWRGFSSWWSSTAAPWFSDIATGFGNWFKSIKEGAAILGEDFKAIWKGVSDWWGKTAAPWFSDIVTGFGNWFKSIKEGAGILWEDLENLWRGFADWWRGTAAPWFADIVTGFGNWFKSIKEGAGILWEDLENLWRGFADWWSGTAAPWFADIAAGFGVWFKSIKEGAGILWEDLKTLWRSFADWWGSTAAPWFSDIATGFGNWFESIKEGASTLWEDLKSLWSDITNWFKAEIAPVFTVQYWTDKFSAIGEGMKAAMNGALTAVETGVNWIISKLNSLSFTVPDWVPGVGGEKFGLNIPTVSVPRLAAGAVIPPNREFLAVLGDQSSGTNIETPLDTMVAAFRQALNDGAGNRTLILKIGEQEFGQLVFNAFSNEDARVGFSSVT